MPKREGDALAGRDQPFGRLGGKRDSARVFLEHDAREGEVAAHVLAQGLRAGGGVELVGFLGFGMRDQLVEEFPADEGMHVRHAFAQQIVLNGAQHLAHLALHIGARGAEQEVHRDLRETELGEVVVERGPRAVFDDAAERVHLHVFAGLGMLAAHQLQLAVHHLDQRVGAIEDAQRRAGPECRRAGSRHHAGSTAGRRSASTAPRGCRRWQDRPAEPRAAGSARLRTAR